ncbi:MULTISPECIES: polysaccharide biosynthesis tyrosine autokinase [unclassified Microbacterium]|uniref:polysaccharide biosynthesis tyrosine autokinase n=1 Tax=unclassified Microbacterium TaxID=2609290 RepID=UPI000EAA65F4|nr:MULTISPECIES: polysaccharide biosynthesis tyrosine autokinase [unclassified Microbacterium]MBT2485011.1 polysaccharide biosynthesis tyrosine autokinase [Microbacterium sp. ISL-108]RKN67861.1 polysaccharide biosynthesis tyrosine autokinase [Microbacterium sp. CGR2]
MELRDYARILRAHWVVVVVATVVGALAAFGWSSLQPRVYSADTTGIVTSVGGDGTSGSALVGNQLAQSRVKSYLNLGSWSAVAEHAIDELDIDASPDALVNRITVTNPIDTTALMVTATGPTPEEAQALAQAWLDGMAIEIEKLEGGTAETPAAISLVVGDSARLPTAPTSPNTRLNVVLGALIGIAAGLVYAFVRHTVDRRVRHPRDIERETGASVIGTLPLEKSMAGERQVIDFSLDSQHGVSHHTIEAMRELRTNLQFIDVDNPPRIIVVTSSVPGDGKSTVSVNLASSLAAAGQWAILIDCDLRRPVVADIFGMSHDVGLTDVLAGRAELQDVAHRPSKDVPLAVVGAGRIPPNPSELLGSRRMRDFLGEISKSAIVILDSPPVLPVTDAAVLAAGADGVLIVVSSGKTTFDMLQRAISAITRTKGRVLGVVLNRVPRKGAESAYYGREYYGTFERYAQDGASDRRNPSASNR